MSVDIVKLIESNPIAKLNGNYQSKLIDKVKNNFSNYEQQMFVASFYCYLNYNPTTEYIINLDDVWEWVGFSKKANAKRILEKHFIINKDYKVLLLPPEQQSLCATDEDKSSCATKDARGGYNKENIMLTIKTFKSFCLKAGTKKADEIHEYYIKMEEVLQQVLQEESNELKQQLIQCKENAIQIADKCKQDYEQKLFKEKQLERQQILLGEFGTIGSIFYIIKVKTFENGQYIVKIGESRIGITGRYNEHKSKYDECLLLDCFLVNRSKDFESFIKCNASITPSKVTNLPGHETEQELFLIGNKLSYKTLLNIIKSNIKGFNDNNNEIKKLELELEILKCKQTMAQPPSNDNAVLQELLNANKVMMNKIDTLENSNKEMMQKLNSMQTKVVSNFNEPLANVGPRLQCINPETLQLIKVYETVTECMKENNKIKRPSINKAIEQNTVYCGFRWLLVDRQLDPNIITHIEPTKPTRLQNLGYIAKLNKDKTEIINVYLDRKTAAECNGYASSSSLEHIVKNGILSNESYYALYDNCEEDLKEDLVAKNGDADPLLYKNGVGQFDSSLNLVREFACKYDCIKMLHISDKTLEKALKNNVMYDGTYFKMLESKVKCF
jgi:hypothetical protein